MAPRPCKRRHWAGHSQAPLQVCRAQHCQAGSHAPVEMVEGMQTCAGSPSQLPPREACPEGTQAQEGEQRALVSRPRSVLWAPALPGHGMGPREARVGQVPCCSSLAGTSVAAAPSGSAAALWCCPCAAVPVVPRGWGLIQLRAPVNQGCVAQPRPALPSVLSVWCWEGWSCSLAQRSLLRALVGAYLFPWLVGGTPERAGRATRVSQFVFTPHSCPARSDFGVSAGNHTCPVASGANP